MKNFDFEIIAFKNSPFNLLLNIFSYKDIHYTCLSLFYKCFLVVLFFCFSSRKEIRFQC